MESWPFWKKAATLAALFAAYVPIALYFNYTYVPQPKPPVRNWISFGPFPLLAGRGWAYVAHLPEYDGLADDIANPEQSPLIVYENEEPLGPAHSSLGDVILLGMGRYSHWRGIGLVFSASDNSDPNR